MNKNLIILAGIVLVVLGIAVTVSNPVGKSHVALYCNSDGELADTMPIQSHRSYCIQSNANALSIQPGLPVPYSFSIIDDQGNTLKNFQTEHEKLLHLIVVRKDLAQFQHVHPTLNQETGLFTLSDLTFPTAGDYRIFADFTPAGAQVGPDGMPLTVVSSEDVTVAGSYTPQALGSAERNKTFNGYQVALSTDPKNLTAGMDMLSFTVTYGGKLVTDLEDYLGALGHSVILKEDTLDYIHTHALEEPTAKQNGTINFHVEFPEGGNYKVFTQFQHQGKVITLDFVLPVVEAENMMLPDMQMDHLMH